MGCSLNITVNSNVADINLILQFISFLFLIWFRNEFSIKIRKIYSIFSVISISDLQVVTSMSAFILSMSALNV